MFGLGLCRRLLFACCHSFDESFLKDSFDETFPKSFFLKSFSWMMNWSEENWVILWVSKSVEMADSSWDLGMLSFLDKVDMER